MSLVFAKRVLFGAHHVPLAPDSHVAPHGLRGARPASKVNLARRFLVSHRSQALTRGARMTLAQNLIPRRISSISPVHQLQLLPRRYVATNIEVFHPEEVVPMPSKHERYHCGSCNYTSKMPIFICNACHSLDPKGGEMDPLTHVHMHSTHSPAKSAGATLEEHQANLRTPVAKCPKHDALPCAVCEPFLKHVDGTKTDASKSRACDFFEFFSCPHKFNMDDKQMRQLTNRYRELQRVLHPDVYSAKDDTTDADLHAVQQQSAALADAYRTLRNPYQRAIYLLGLHGIDVNKLNESQYESMLGGSATGASGHAPSRPNLAQLKSQEQAMLMHVMEVRETLEESEDVEEIKDILVAASAQVEQCLRAMEGAFEKKDLFDARHRTVLLNYLSKIQQEAESKLEALHANIKKSPL